MKRKHLLLSFTFALSSALLIIFTILLRPSTQSLGQPLTETTLTSAVGAEVPNSRMAEALPDIQPALTVASPLSLRQDDTNRPPESSFPTAMHTQAVNPRALAISAQTQGNGHVPVGINQQELLSGFALDRVAEPTQSPQIYARYDTNGHNDVFGFNAVADSPVLITITHPINGIIATGSTTAGTCDGCNPTDYQLDFPDWMFSAGVSVTVDCGSGMIESVMVVSITGDPDPDTDMVIGSAPSESQLNVWVHRPGDETSLSTEVDASGVYTLDMGAEGWDILPGDRFHVYYPAPGGHYVESIFWVPAPEVGVSKWQMGGFARPGGKIVYGLSYWNDGDAIATDVIITDTLPVSTTWAGDTSGLTPDIDANGVITWHIGNLPDEGIYGNWGVFAVTLDVDPDVPGALGGNCATISTSTPGDTNPDDNTACASPVDVQDSDVGINIDKWPNPDDPAPGQEFQYTIRTCSDYGANFGPVWLTDTLPVSTTVVSWSADWPWGLWTEVITTGGQFVLYAPGLPGGWCQQIYLRLLLDPNAPQGMTLSNHIVVATPGDAQPDNNERLNEDAHVSGPRHDLNADKWFNNGVLVPGGWINYGANHWNGGNVPAHNVWLTDTLPVGTTYQPNSAWRDNGQNFPPDAVSSEAIAWNVGDVAVADGFGFSFSVDIDESVAPGTVLTNCITVEGAEPDEYLDDNTRCVTLKVFASGPNLRVTKESWWNGDGQLGYRVYFYNLGDEAVSDVWITDTLPTGTTWDGWWNLNFDQSRLVSESLHSDILAWQFSALDPGDTGNIEFNANLDEPGVPVRWFTNTVEITLPVDDADPDDNTYETVDFSGGELQWVDLDVYRNRIWGCAPQGPVTVTTAMAEMNFGDCWDEQNFPDTFDPGDVITITAGAGMYPVIITVPDPFTGRTSSVTDTIWGQIDSLDHEMVEVDLWGFPTQSVETDDQGNYSATYPDIPRGAQGDVGYWTEIGYAQVGFHHRLFNPDLALQINYAHDWVEGNYEAGHTLLLTVTDSAGAIKATAELTTGVIPWWNGGVGFSTNLDNPWSPERPDIAPGDWVHGVLDGIYASDVQIGKIDGEVDTDHDLVTATLHVDWFSEMLNVDCGVENGPGTSFMLDPDGGSAVCDFGAMGWDLQPGEDVWLWYHEPDYDQVGNVVFGPAPNTRINIQADGNPGVGGNFIFRVSYRNEGNHVAEGTVITATLEGATYITDTSGLSYTGGGSGPVVWDLGDLAPGDWVEFYVFVQVTANEGETVADTVQIATANPYDMSNPWDRESRWEGQAQANDTYLNIGKWSWTGDPAAGYDIVFQLNPCNNGGTGSSEVTIADTLHPSMTLQTWWGDAPGWAEMSRSAQQLVLTRPAISGWRCEGIYVRATIDASAWPGMSISNTATVYAVNDLSGDDNETTWWGNVNDPHTNLNINKSWGNGQLVPGGELNYWINVNNNGNVPVGAFHITDTLPVSTTFSAAWHQDQYGQYPFTPIIIGDGYVVWEFAGLDNGYSDNFRVVLDVDFDALPGTVLVNTAEVTSLPSEDNYDDNVSKWTETLFDHGSNLRVRKDGRWDDWGTDTRHASYWVNIENIGDTVIAPVIFTDTYDSRVRLDGGIGVNYWRWWDWHDDPANHVFTVTLESLYPGDSVGVNYGTYTDTAPLPFGLIFTNTAEVALDPYDINPDDNTDTFVLTTGPDLWVKKNLVDGKLLPGELVTFSLAFGNDRYGNEWWWNTQGSVWLTDTLPSGFEFITATRRSQGWAPWPPSRTDGDQLAWDTGYMPAGGEDELLVTVRIPASASGLDTFTNLAEVASDQPAVDIEPYYDNNTNYADVMVDLPYFEVSKNHESTAIAGAPITYTLTVTNVGNSMGTGVILSDTIPAGLENVSGGTILMPWVWWYIDSLAANGGVATEMFAATLPCRGTVVNDDYRVVDSDQGVTSAVGAPVSLDVLAPTLNVGFDQSAVTALVSTTLRFTDTSSTNGPPVAAWTWDFDDGHSASGANATHTYTADGVFTVRLTITDTCGYTATTTSAVTVTAPALVANFVQSTVLAEIGATVYFTDTSTTDLPPIVAWTWDFGDDSPMRFTQNVSHTYSTEDTFTVTLTITDTLGYSDSYESAIQVVSSTQRIFLPLVLRNY